MTVLSFHANLSAFLNAHGQTVTATVWGVELRTAWIAWQSDHYPGPFVAPSLSTVPKVVADWIVARKIEQGIVAERTATNDRHMRRNLDRQRRLVQSHRYQARWLRLLESLPENEVPPADPTRPGIGPMGGAQMHFPDPTVEDLLPENRGRIVDTGKQNVIPNELPSVPTSVRAVRAGVS